MTNISQDLDEIEEWNEFGELKENIGPVPTSSAAPSSGRQGVNIRPVSHGSPPETDGAIDIPHPNAYALVDESSRVALPGAAEVAERSASKSPPILAKDPPAIESITSASANKEKTINAAKEIAAHHPSLDHLSAPASRIQSGHATPQTEPASGADIVAQATQGRTHRGSEVKEAPIEEIRKLESESALQEDPGEDAEEAEDDAAKRVSHLRFEEPVKTQEQPSKEPADASRSVED